MIRNYMKRLFLAVMAIVLVLGASSFVQPSPVQGAETVVPAYGADANPTGNPIGGGTGYTHIIDSSTAKYVVSTKSQLLSALASATSGQIIYVADSAQIDLTDSSRINVPTGVILASGRGQNGSSGGLIYTNDTTPDENQPSLFMIKNGVRVTGLRLRGPSGEMGTYSQGYLYSGLNIISDADVEVDNCEIYNWPLCGIGAGDGSTPYIHHNYIHNCRRVGFGYGIGVMGASALIEANLFNYNRHSVMGNRDYPVTNYEACYNVFETGCTQGQSCDMHGGNDVGDASVPAGGTVLIHHNTFKAIWNSVNIRGIPSNQVSVYKNWALHDPDDWSPYDVFMQSLDNLGYTPYVRMKVYDNWYGSTPPPGVTPNDPPAKPSAPIGPTSGETATSYEYRATTTDPDGDTVSYTFYWSDGSTSTTGLLNSGATAYVSHTWTKAGTYAVYVGATDSEGNASDWSSGLTVEIAATSNNPPATPSAPLGTTSGAMSTSYQYRATTTDPDSDKVCYTFYWSDGSTSTTDLLDSGATAYVSHTWTGAGTYTVYVRATDSKGANSAWSPGLTVEIADSSNDPPAKPSTPVGTASGVILTQYQYQSATIDPDGDRVWYTFYWGDGSTSTTSLLDPGATVSAGHAWTEAGTYGVYVMATDSEGNDSSWSYGLTVKVTNPLQPSGTTNIPPTVPSSLSGTTSGEISTVYQYSAVATDPNADTLLYTFDWGDGSSSTTAQVDSGVAATADHAWTEPGTYAIQVKATDSKGAVSASSTALTVNVLVQPPAPAPETPAPETPAPATPAPAPETPATVKPAVETPTAIPPVDPANAVASDPSSNPSPAPLDNGGSPLVPAHGSGFGWWLLIVSVLVGAAFVSVRAIVRYSVPDEPDGEGY